MHLALDIGNTLTKVGVFDEKTLVDKEVLQGIDRDRLRLLIGKWHIEHVIISSVGQPFDPDDLKVSGVVLELTEETPVPVRSRYTTPATLGKDRLAAVVGAHSIFPHASVLVIDTGTCITYDLVDDKGVFHGGNIAPGLDMRFQAMHEFTSRLPLVSRADVPNMLGRSSTEALQNGGFLGVLMEITGYIELLKKEHASLVTILTGGDAAYFAERLKTEIFVRPDLVLTGLNEILLAHVAKLN